MLYKASYTTFGFFFIFSRIPKKTRSHKSLRVPDPKKLEFKKVKPDPNPNFGFRVGSGIPEKKPVVANPNIVCKIEKNLLSTDVINNILKYHKCTPDSPTFLGGIIFHIAQSERT